MAPVAWLLLILFGLAALQSAASLVLHQASQTRQTVFSTPEADATHLLMNAVMAVMVTPAYTSAVRSGSVVLLVVAALGVALALISHRPGAPSPGPLSFTAYAAAAAYHVLMLAAMIYALSAMVPGMGSMGPAAMSSMGRARAASGRWLPHGLAVLFALDAATGSIAVVALPRQLLAAETAGAAFAADIRLWRSIRALRLSFLPHLVMDAGMAWMLLAS